MQHGRLFLGRTPSSRVDSAGNFSRQTEKQIEKWYYEKIKKIIELKPGITWLKCFGLSVSRTFHSRMQQVINSCSGRAVLYIYVWRERERSERQRDVHRSISIANISFLHIDVLLIAYCWIVLSEQHLNTFKQHLINPGLEKIKFWRMFWKCVTHEAECYVEMTREKFNYSLCRYEQSNQNDKIFR